jgi:hypothetical protein
MRTLTLTAAVSLTLLFAACSSQPPQTAAAAPVTSAPYQENTILQEAETFFGRGAQGVADVLNKAFSDNGPPDAYIKGEEVGAALGVGLTYGHGDVYLSDGTTSKVYWRGPSIGLDVGGNASKVFVLIYDLPTMDALYERYGGVEGSLYFVGGVGVTYNQRDDVTLAPVRFGVGWRQGINVGYLHLSPESTWIPF